MSLFEKLLEQAPPRMSSFHIGEPLLTFGSGHDCPDPKLGLREYGPILSGQAKAYIRVGIVATGKGIDAASRYLSELNQRITPGKNRKGSFFSPTAFPDFPGIQNSFRVVFATDKTIQRQVALEEFKLSVRSSNPSKRLQAVVDIVVRELEVLAAVEPTPDVVIVALPQEVEDECKTVGSDIQVFRPKLTAVQKFVNKLQKAKARGQELLGLEFDIPEEEQPGSGGCWNIHHAFKANAMKTRLTTQLIWESTLYGKRTTQDPASTAWNVATALYYKSGNIPWRLAHVPPNTCFVGVAFYKAGPHSDADMHTSLAQVFSGAGEGLIIRGQKAFVDKAKNDRRPHLTAAAAQDLIQRAVATYAAHHQNTPDRVVIHKTSKYWPDELTGFQRGLGAVKRFDFVALDHRGHRFMRCGSEPPLRGTVVSLNRDHHVLYTQGYVPFLKCYPGLRIPSPLEIVEHYGESPIYVLCEEILALTKINWNSCFFGSSMPITIRFARNVGKILAELPVGVDPESKYKFYM